MFKLLTLNTLSAHGLKQFPKNLYEISNQLENPTAILVRSANLHEFNFASSVLAVGRAGAGTNNIPIQQLTARGIPVFNTPGANANAVRELVLAGMLLASRHIVQAWDYVKQLAVEDDKLEASIEQHKKNFVGKELLGKTLGVVGLGSVGVKVANAAINLGMQVIGFDPTITVSRAWELSANVKQAANLDYLLSHSDFVSVHVPLNDSTKKLLNAERMQKIKNECVLLNFAREGIVDNEALLAALNAKKLHTYVTDFPTPALKNHPQVINLPHLGASTKEAEENCAVMLVAQIREFLENGGILNAVNFPRVELPPTSAGTRLTVVNANVPNMVAQISAVLADAKLNILSLVNKSLNEIAYTVVDVNQALTAATLDKVKTIPGVIQVRKI